MMLTFRLLVIVCIYFTSNASGNSYTENCTLSYSSCDCDFMYDLNGSNNGVQVYCPKKHNPKINVTVTINHSVHPLEAYMECDETMSVDDYDLIYSKDVLGLLATSPLDLFRFTCKNCRTRPLNGTEDIFRKFPNVNLTDTVILDECLSLGSDYTFRREQFNRLTEVRDLTVKSATVSSLSTDTFDYSTNITKLELNFPNVRNMNGELFRNQRKLKTLVLKQTPVNLNKEFFNHLSRITVLHIEQCVQSDTLQSNVFELLTHVEELKLTNNGFTVLPSGLFDSNEHLRTLTIIEPSLKAQPNFLTANLRQLSRFTLSSTSIVDIDGDYSMNTELTFLDLSNNKFTTAPYPGSLEKLTTVILANNKLKKIFFVFGFYSERPRDALALNLSGNQIDRISYWDLHDVHSSSTIDLRNNGLTTIDLSDIWHYWQYWQTVNITLHLDGNPINCDESLIDFIAYNEYPKKSMQITVIGGECSQPDSLAKRPLSQIDFNILMHQRRDFISEFCSIDCDCNFRRVDRMFVMNCTKEGLRQLRRFPNTKYLGYDFIELYFANQKTTEFPDLTHIEGMANVIYVNASNNNIQYVSRSMFSESLKSLDLSNNKLISVDKDVIELWEGSSKLKELWLNGNPFECDCDTQLLKAFYSNTSKVINYRGITCANKAGKPLHEVDDLCTDGYIVVIVLSLAFFVALLLSFYYKYREIISVWLYATFGRSIGRYLPEKPFDAFLSFAEPDNDYVFNHLVPALENGPEQYRLCIHVRDWIAAPIMEQIHESVRYSRYTIIVLSKNFLRSNWCTAEFRAAQLQANEERRSNVIVVMYGDVNEDDVKDSASEMQAYLRANTYLRCDDPWFLKKLRYSMRRSRRERVGVRTLESDAMEMNVQKSFAPNSDR